MLCFNFYNADSQKTEFVVELLLLIWMFSSLSIRCGATAFKHLHINCKKYLANCEKSRNPNHENIFNYVKKYLSIHHSVDTSHILMSPHAPPRCHFMQKRKFCRNLKRSIVFAARMNKNNRCDSILGENSLFRSVPKRINGSFYASDRILLCMVSYWFDFELIGW